jgi:hypothetical protein
VSVTPSTDASVSDAGGPTTTACVIPAAANYGQQSPTDMGCWAETSDPVLPCSAGTYPLTCGSGTPLPELGCGAGVGGPPRNMFYCCVCGGVDAGIGADTDAATTEQDAGATDTGTPDGSGTGGGSNPDDASFDVASPPMGQAGFAWIIDGVVQTPLSCPAYNWEFPPPPSFPSSGTGDAVCNATTPPCPGISSVLLLNTGAVPLAYTIQPLWMVGGSGYPPGVQFGDAMELSGVLSPGERVEAAQSYLGGITAVLGASEPFSNQSHYVSDEGTIPWPAGVAGSNGSTTMNVAVLTTAYSCVMPSTVW